MDGWIDGESIESVQSFKYLGAILTDEGSKKEVLSRIAQATTSFNKLQIIWKSNNVSIKTKIRLMRSLVVSVLLYACESWTLTAELERRIEAAEMRFYREILKIKYYDHISNKKVLELIKQKAGEQEPLLTTAKTRKLRWFGHVTRSGGLAKTFLQGTVNGTRRRGRQRKRWEDNIREWTGLTLYKAMRETEDRDGWKRIIKNVCEAPQRSFQ